MDGVASTCLYVFGDQDSDYGSGVGFMTKETAKHAPQYGLLFFRLYATGFATDKMVTRWFHKELEADLRALSKLSDN